MFDEEISSNSIKQGVYNSVAMVSSLYSTCGEREIYDLSVALIVMAILIMGYAIFPSVEIWAKQHKSGQVAEKLSKYIYIWSF